MEFCSEHPTHEPVSPIASSAWIDPRGRFFAVRDCGHDDFAYEHHSSTVTALERQGWLHVSFGMIMTSARELANSQIDTLYDTLAAYQAAGYEYAEKFETYMNNLIRDLSGDTSEGW